MEALKVEGRLKGLLDVGHHIIVDRLGNVYRLRPLDVIGCHTPGHNHESISVCIIGGLSEDGERREDNFTPQQHVALKYIFGAFMKEYPEARIVTRHQLQKRRGDQGSMARPAMADLSTIISKAAKAKRSLSPLSVMFKSKKERTRDERLS